MTTYMSLMQWWHDWRSWPGSMVPSSGPTAAIFGGHLTSEIAHEKSGKVISGNVGVCSFKNSPGMLS